MRKHHLLVTLLLIGGLIGNGVAVQAQQEKNQNDGVKGPSPTHSEPRGEQTETKESTQLQTKVQVQTDDPPQQQEQKQDRKREQLHSNEDAPCFSAEDGNTYRWQRRFSRKLQRLEEQGNQEAMNKYLEKIANRYSFEYSNGADDFVHWAIQNRPWDTE
jgi:hypothetical protein